MIQSFSQGWRGRDSHFSKVTQPAVWNIDYKGWEWKPGAKKNDIIQVRDSGGLDWAMVVEGVRSG